MTPTKALALLLAVALAVPSCVPAGTPNYVALSRTPLKPASQPASRAARPAVGKQAVERLVGLLGNDRFQVREEATQKLIKLGLLVRPLLEAKLADKNLEPEAAARIKTVLDDVASWALDAGEVARRQDQAAEALGVPKELVLDLGNRVFMKFILIPSGQFLMGSPESEPGRREEEGPHHKVSITNPFYMGIYHVTCAQYNQIMYGSTGSPGSVNIPVCNVSQHHAYEFCKKLSQKTRKPITLPTEAQWEYACRAGTTTPFNTGDTISTAMANINGNSARGDGQKGQHRNGPTPVGSFMPNAWGLYDMHGNVSQWCADWFDKDFYTNSPEADPRGPESGRDSVLRGGWWFCGPYDCRSARRGWSGPSYANPAFGFRVICTVAEEQPESGGTSRPHSFRKRRY